MKRIAIVTIAVAVVGAAVFFLVGGKPQRVLRLATTTSTENSGLLAYLLPVFEREHGVEVHVIAVGTGKALALARNGDVDAVMVHAPRTEEAFMAEGHGVNRRGFMKNDFHVVGPPADPAGLRKTKTLAAALAALTKAPGAVFVSRGDDSGTHKKELILWDKAGVTMPAAVYLEIGQGMEAALRMAHEKGAYTLTDRGTYLALRGELELAPVFEGDPGLDNPYSIMATNPARHPHVAHEDARLLVDWLTQPAAQKLIGAFQVGGEVLFHPTAAAATP